MYHRYLGSYVDAYILDGTSQLGCALLRLLWTWSVALGGAVGRTHLCGLVACATRIRTLRSYFTVM